MRGLSKKGMLKPPAVAEQPAEKKHEPLIFSMLPVALAKAGTALVMLNASPHQPLGIWLYRLLIKRKE